MQEFLLKTHPITESNPELPESGVSKAAKNQIETAAEILDLSFRTKEIVVEYSQIASDTSSNTFGEGGMLANR